MRKIAISDIHGCAKTFKILLKEGVRLRQEDQLYLLGDYVDRGPDVKGVIDFIWELKEQNYQVHCLRGNHEAMMLEAIQGGNPLELWLANGGRATLESFGADYVEQIPRAYLDFAQSLDYVLEVDEYILVHAGLNFSSPNPLEPCEDMLWIRWWYDEIDYDWLQNRYIVHGHTPVPWQDIRQMHKKLDARRFIDIDNGCFAFFRPNLGQLCAFDLTHRQLYFQPNIEADT
ncbi:MAG: serine/threonine protein phosphatase [Bacteroidetes bacterium]|nr:MAG: serine/threonine protein phosphatase [Bacteroidota bacterium]